jgi:hypothetical protein
VYKSLTTSVVILALATSGFAVEPTETKPIAKMVQMVPCRAPIPGPVQDWSGAERVVVIRSGEELVARSATPEQAKDPIFQRVMTAWLADTLKVQTINWETQMVVGVHRGSVSDLEIHSVIPQDGTTNIQIVAPERFGRCLPSYVALALVPRSKGEVKFVTLEVKQDKK